MLYSHLPHTHNHEQSESYKTDGEDNCDENGIAHHCYEHDSAHKSKEEDREPTVKSREDYDKKTQTGAEMTVVTVVWQFGQRTTVGLFAERRRVILCQENSAMRSIDGTTLWRPNVSSTLMEVVLGLL